MYTLIFFLLCVVLSNCASDDYNTKIIRLAVVGCFIVITITMFILLAITIKIIQYICIKCSNRDELEETDQ